MYVVCKHTVSVKATGQLDIYVKRIPTETGLKNVLDKLACPSHRHSDTFLQIVSSSFVQFKTGNTADTW